MSLNSPITGLDLGSLFPDEFIFGSSAPARGWVAARVGDWVEDWGGGSGWRSEFDPSGGVPAVVVLPVGGMAAAKPSGSGNGGGGGKPAPGPDDGTVGSFTSGGDAATSYNIKIDFSGSWSVTLQQAFIDAANFFSQLILEDIPDVFFRGKVIDDLTLSASLSEIDGTGGILGQAGPTVFRTASYLPAAGKMEFDIADAQTFFDLGLWEEIVFHEMSHCLGFGTMFDIAGMTSGSIAGGDLVFTGENAAYEYSLLGGSGFVPLETDGGAGTAGGHWDEGDTVMGETEIMTGYIDATNYLSTVTIAALEDFGYDTVYDDRTTTTDLTGAYPDSGFMFA